ncbi:substrate-binding domain-containing protein [Streptomyces griseoruber]|uniref:substrate-binding domain-containing protein n=1 Tax=Streptomyces griseoruber TaxID=1943 RepID=UPI001F0B3012|nr:substrate-binding domain-containing protein [Streptomyces griseoruber]
MLEDITGPSFAHMAHGVEREAHRLGHLCLVCSTEGDVREELDFVETMRAQRATAVILVGAADTPEYREHTRRTADSPASAGSRLALCGRPPLGPGAPVTVVEYDNEGGAFALVAHVLTQGHRRCCSSAADPTARRRSAASTATSPSRRTGPAASRRTRR